MKLLLDTCVLSELQKTNCNPVVKEWVFSVSDCDTFISVMSIGEILKGINLLEKGHFQSELISWLGNIERYYEKQILPIDIETTKIWAEITATAQKSGKILPAIDTLIAASAIKHGLHVMTRNVKDFKPTGALIINPWETQ